MAYTRINWQDLPSTSTPRNATNLNKMDSAIKDHDDKLSGNTSMGSIKTTGVAINDIPVVINDYAAFYMGGASLTGVSAWSQIQVPFGSNNGTFITNNSSNFESNSNYIKCKFKGKILVIRQLSMNYNGEIDIIDEFGWMNGISTNQNASFAIKDVDVNYNVNFVFSGGMSGSVQLYQARIIVIRIT